MEPHPEARRNGPLPQCGTVKCYRLDYTTVYGLASSTQVLEERPACTGKPTQQLNDDA